MKTRFLYILLFVSTGLLAQIQHGGLPVGKQGVQVKSTRSTVSSTVDMPTFEIPEQTTVSSDEVGNKALTFAHTFDVNLSTSNSGEWSTTSTGSSVWHLTIRSSEASSINLIFDQFRLPKGGKVFLYNADMSYVLGAFTDENNKASGILPTSPIPGEEIIVEYQAPENAEFEAELSIGKVNHDYSNIFFKTGEFGDSESCEMDVTCYSDDVYQKVRRSTVKLIIAGTELMTGTLINNTNEDGTPYVLTAAHGYESHGMASASTLFIFNHQVPLCHTDIEGTREQSVAGGTLVSYSPKVNNEALDFALVEMSVKPPTTYQAYYAGWTRSNTSPSNTFCIHHPMGDVKKISFDDNALTQISLAFGGTTYYPYGHWRVATWEVGVTEGGSSGSGLFNPQGQLIGGLSAGAASCSSTYNDYFFRFDLAWDASAEIDEQLAYWLDPNDTDLNELGAYESDEVTHTNRHSHITDTSNVTTGHDANNGYIAGNNSIGITHFVEKFENSSSKQILGFYFVAAEGNSNSVINTSIWTGNQYPEQEVLNETLVLNQWNFSTAESSTGTTGGHSPKDDFTMQENFVLLSEPISVTSNYFIGFEVDNEQQDNPFGLILTNDDTEDNAYYYDTQWKSYSALADYNRPTSLWIDPIVQTGSTSVDNNNNNDESNIRIFPNPAKNGVPLTIILNNNNASTISIYDMLGRKHEASQHSQNENTLTINIDSLPTGTYILHAGTEKVLFQKI